MRQRMHASMGDCRPRVVAHELTLRTCLSPLAHLQGFEPQHLSNMLWALSALGIVHFNAFDAANILSGLGVDPEDVGSSTGTAGSSGSSSGGRAGVLLGQQRLGDATQQAPSNALYALSRLQCALSMAWMDQVRMGGRLGNCIVAGG